MPSYPDQTEFSPVVARVHAYLREEELWTEGAHLLVAVSGGPDSVALLDMLACVLAPPLRLRLTVAHVNHLLRAEAAEDAAFVEGLAARYGLPFMSREVDVPGRVAATGESVEEAARTLRYAALQELAQDAGATHIATGHTADDQAETVLMRVLRGTGITGLAGIPARRENIVRPLLIVWRSEILAYLRDRGLEYRTDISNYSTEFTRNRVRLELIPHLETAYAPRLRQRLQHLAELARQDEAVLEQWARDTFTQARQLLPDGVALSALPETPRAIQWRVWRMALATVRGGLADIGYEHLEDIQRLGPGQQVHLPGVRVLHEAGRLVFLPAPPDGERVISIPEEPLPVPGRLCLLEAGCCLTVETLIGPPPLAGGDVAVLDAAAVRLPLTVRAWRPGDRFRPLGAPGSRKVQDIFVDAGVPRRLRTRIPVVLDADGIIWLAGFRLADRVKMEPATTDCLRFSIEWELNPWTLKLFDAL